MLSVCILPLAAQEGGEMTVRAAVATLLGQLAKQPLHGPRVALLLGRLLPPGLVAAIQVCVPVLLHRLLPWVEPRIAVSLQRLSR